MKKVHYFLRKSKKKIKFAKAQQLNGSTAQRLNIDIVENMNISPKHINRQFEKATPFWARIMNLSLSWYAYAPTNNKQLLGPMLAPEKRNAKLAQIYAAQK